MNRFVENATNKSRGTKSENGRTENQDLQGLTDAVKNLTKIFEQCVASNTRRNFSNTPCQATAKPAYNPAEKKRGCFRCGKISVIDYMDQEELENEMQQEN